MVACPNAIFYFYFFLGWFFVVFWLGVLWGMPPAERVFVQVVAVSPGFDEIFVFVEVGCDFSWRVVCQFIPREDGAGVLLGFHGGCCCFFVCFNCFQSFCFKGFVVGCFCFFPFFVGDFNG